MTSAPGGALRIACQASRVTLCHGDTMDATGEVPRRGQVPLAGRPEGARSPRQCG